MSYRRYLCAALEFLHFHSPDCEHCSVPDCIGVAMRRLRELNEHSQRVCQQKSWGERIAATTTQHDSPGPCVRFGRPAGAARKPQSGAIGCQRSPRIKSTKGQ